MAFTAGQDEIAFMLAHAGATVNRTDKRGRTLLHELVSDGPTPHDVKRALQLGVSVSVVDQYGWTPLHFAAAYGYIDTVRVLIAAGADPTVQTTDGKTPHDFAIASGHTAIARVLSSS